MHHGAMVQVVESDPDWTSSQLQFPTARLITC